MSSKGDASIEFERLSQPGCAAGIGSGNVGQTLRKDAARASGCLTEEAAHGDLDRDGDAMLNPSPKQSESPSHVSRSKTVKQLFLCLLPGYTPGAGLPRRRGKRVRFRDGQERISLRIEVRHVGLIT
jgi:hypothetical protein